MNLLEQKIGTYWNKYKTETDAVILEHKVIHCKYKLILILCCIGIFVYICSRSALDMQKVRLIIGAFQRFRDNHEFNNSEIITNLHLHTDIFVSAK